MGARPGPLDPEGADGHQPSPPSVTRGGPGYKAARRVARGMERNKTRTEDK